ncbi:MAG TPA: DUF3488 domain-containing protein [Porticoccaceae bacterium]|nr:DUF3488 domain-containing protein [Porticoccaceae bacterium]
MQPSWQTPRTALWWMLVSVCVVLALHHGHLPPWLLVLALVSVGWQVQIYRGAWRLPRTLIKALLGLSCMGGVILSYGRLTGLEPMVVLLISGFLLKLLEIHHRRDALVVVYLAYFIVAIQCLFDQGMLTALNVIAGMCVVTAALVALFQYHEPSRGKPGVYWRPLRSSLLITLQAIPLMVVLFVVMPRIGALWAVPKPADSGTIGMSDSMSPGDFTDLGADTKVAFRVEFEGEIPPQPALYWRGLVFSQFDGRTWSQTGPWGYRDGATMQWYGEPAEPWDEQISRRGEPLDYRVTMEASNSPWLFALSTPLPQSRGAALTRDFRLFYKHPIGSEMQYRVRSWLDYQLEAGGLTRWRQKMELALPDGFNPRTRQVAEQWFREAPDTDAFIKRVLQLYNDSFVYTLKPPALGKHTVDEFLWQSQRGFCEHFASSFVFFMRAAGVPARVVVGYQGGERHPSENYLLVHQYDAHAWAEVWLPDRGWVRVDPTAAVAPERIEMSFADLFAENEDFLSESLLALERYRHIDWVNRLRLRLDSLEYTWAKWVLGYENVQGDFLLRLLGRIDPLRIGLFLLLAGLIALTPVAVMMLRGREKSHRDELDKLFISFCRRMASAGLSRRSGEGARDFARRVALERPDLAGEVVAFASAYEQQRYGVESFDPAGLRGGLRRLQKRLGWRI